MTKHLDFDGPLPYLITVLHSHCWEICQFHINHRRFKLPDNRCVFKLVKYSIPKSQHILI